MIKAKRVIFVVLVTISVHFTASGQGCNCPPEDSCGPCVGDLISVTLQYNGFLAVSIIATDNSGWFFVETYAPKDPDAAADACTLIAGGSGGRRDDHNRDARRQRALYACHVER